MPNRTIRDGFLDSESVNKLDHATECFYHRLIIASDDAGRADARPAVLASKVYPSQGMSAADVKAALKVLCEVGLVRVYEVGDKSVVQVMNWQRYSPATISRFPSPSGSFAIEWIERETRDGVKSFVRESIRNYQPKQKKLLPSPEEPPLQLDATPDDSDKTTADTVIAYYNAKASNSDNAAREATVITPKRKAKINSLLRKFPVIRENWKAAIDRAFLSTFLAGKTQKIRTFYMTLEWIINETNITKIIEGKYDDANAKSTSGTGATKSSAGGFFSRRVGKKERADADVPGVPSDRLL